MVFIIIAITVILVRVLKKDDAGTGAGAGTGGGGMFSNLFNNIGSGSGGYQWDWDFGNLGGGSSNPCYIQDSVTGVQTEISCPSGYNGGLVPISVYLNQRLKR